MKLTKNNAGGEAYWWRVCYQPGLPRLVSVEEAEASERKCLQSSEAPPEPQLYALLAKCTLFSNDGATAPQKFIRACWHAKNGAKNN